MKINVEKIQEKNNIFTTSLLDSFAYKTLFKKSRFKNEITRKQTKVVMFSQSFHNIQIIKK